MAAEGDEQERHLDPSERKLEKAREEGRFPQSRDLSFVILLGLVFGFTSALGHAAWQACDRLVRDALDLRLAADPLDLMALWAGTALWNFMVWLLAFLVGCLLLGALAPLALASLRPVFAFKFDLNRLDPVAGLGRMFSAQNLFALAKGVAVTIALLAAATVFVWLHVDALLPTPTAPVEATMRNLGQAVGDGATWLLGVVVLTAAIDAAFQWSTFRRQMRMSLQEVKDEQKESEGSPEIRARIRSLQREASRRRMMSAVEKADVLVVNPTHYAVALRYDADRMVAPTVVAKGEDELALTMRAAAKQHGVPVAASPVLARWLSANVDVGKTVPAAVYGIAAQLLAWAYDAKGTSNPSQAPEALDSEAARLP